MGNSRLEGQLLAAIGRETIFVVGNRIAAQLASFAQPFKKALHTVASVGCDGVQIDARADLRPAELSETGLRQLRKMLDDLNLRVGSVAFLTRRGLSSREQLQERVDATIAAMRFASALGARTLVCTLGSLPESESAPERTSLEDVLQTLASHSHRLGVRLAAQAASASPTALSSFVDSLSEGALGLDLHPGQLLAHGHSPREFVEVAGKHVCHLHAVDAVRDLSTGSSEEVQLGRGTVDFAELLGMLDEHGYRDWITLERRHASQPIEEMQCAVQYLRTI